MSRNLRASIGLDEFSTRRLEELMNEFLPDAKLKLPVSEDVVPRNVEVHPKDRHVLAAALSTDADILLTDNTKDFPAEWMTRKGIELDGPFHCSQGSKVRTPITVNCTAGSRWRLRG